MDNLEVKQAITQLHTSFDEFKKANDARLKEVEKKGAADPVTEEKLSKLDNTIATLQSSLEAAGKKTAEKLSEIEKLAARPGAIGKDAPSAEQQAHKSAFQSFLRKGNENGLRELESKAMSVGSDADGGYLVTPEVSTSVITRQFDTTPMRQYATVMTISSDSVEFLRDTDEAEANWVGEQETRSDTNNPQIGKSKITVFELSASPKATQKLLDDSSLDVEQWLAMKVADKFSRTENNAFVNGNGVAKPRGFLSFTTAATGDASRAWGTLEHVATGNSGAFPASNPQDKLIEVMNALRAFYQTGAVWMMPRSVITAVRKFKDTTGQYLWQPSLQAGQPSLLLGAPVVQSEDMPAIAANSLSVAFGNFKEGYTIVDRLGIRVLRDPFTGHPFVKFRTTKRVGGDVTNFEAIKLLKFA